MGCRPRLEKKVHFPWDLHFKLKETLKLSTRPEGIPELRVAIEELEGRLIRPQKMSTFKIREAYGEEKGSQE